MARKLDRAKTSKILYGAAAVLALVAIVILGIKNNEDRAAEKSAGILLDAYRESEAAAATNAPQAPDTTAVSAEHRIHLDDDLLVDEGADYIPPAEPVSEEAEELMRQIMEAVGDGGVIGTIEIPKTEQEYPIIGKWSYKLLEISICRYEGGEPNERGNNLVLIGHNYNSGAHFGNLKKLEIGDEIFLTGKNGVRIRYVVYEVKHIASDNFKALDEYRGESGLTLMTCNNSGSDRLLVRCETKPEGPASEASTEH